MLTRIGTLTRAHGARAWNLVTFSPAPLACAAALPFMRGCGSAQEGAWGAVRRDASTTASASASAQPGDKATDGEEAPKVEADTKTEAGEGESEVARLQGMLAEKESEVLEMNDKLLRAFAEMENVRTRMTNQANDAKKFAVQGFAKELLDVADNLRRAVDAVPEAAADIDAATALAQLKTLKEGVTMTEAQLMQVFGRNGLKMYKSLGEEFDPNKHMALFRMPDPDKPNNIVANVVKEGYTLNDRVIRPAEVGVVQN